PRGRTEAPRFLQLALLLRRGGRVGSRDLYDAAVDIERETEATVVSLSRHTAVYKLRGAGHQLVPYFADLADPLFATSAAFGHNRYATNTTTSFVRVQPFPVFAHNGEINTISRLRDEARSLGLPLSREGSDSQDVDAVIRGLVMRFRLRPIEALELLFPPIVNEIKRMTPPEQDAYVQARAALGPLAQGPAAILSRVGDTCVFGVDALGLRPLWHVETADTHVFASERGFIPLERYVADPVPLGPGERVALERRDGGWRFLDQAAPRANLADYLHETVAVVTNPAIDREREIEHFSTRALLGPRPTPRAQRARPWIELLTPILLGGHAPETGLSSDDFRKLARERGT